MHVDCPFCDGHLRQARNRDGPNFCPKCQKLFYVPQDPKTPPWILGVLVILVANWQIIVL